MPVERTPARVSAPGDIILTRSKGWAGWWIRLGAALRNSHAVHNHVIVAHHTDDAGTPWGIEARPGGVGWVDCRRALRDPWTLTNAPQPRSDQQRALICEVVRGMLGTPYDWGAIAGAGMQAIGAQALWAQDFHGHGPPAHVICSALADWAHLKAGLPSPRGTATRLTTPGDWATFITVRGWE